MLQGCCWLGLAGEKNRVAAVRTMLRILAMLAMTMVVTIDSAMQPRLTLRMKHRVMTGEGERS